MKTQQLVVHTADEFVSQNAEMRAALAELRPTLTFDGTEDSLSSALQEISWAFLAQDCGHRYVLYTTSYGDPVTHYTFKVRGSKSGRYYNPELAWQFTILADTDVLSDVIDNLIVWQERYNAAYMMQMNLDTFNAAFKACAAEVGLTFDVMFTMKGRSRITAVGDNFIHIGLDDAVIKTLAENPLLCADEDNYISTLKKQHYVDFLKTCTQPLDLVYTKSTFGQELKISGIGNIKPLVSELKRSVGRALQYVKEGIGYLEEDIEATIKVNNESQRAVVKSFAIKERRLVTQSEHEALAEMHGENGYILQSAEQGDFIGVAEFFVLSRIDVATRQYI